MAEMQEIYKGENLKEGIITFSKKQDVMTALKMFKGKIYHERL